MHSMGEWWMWGGFFLFIGLMLFVDMFLFGGKKAHRVSTKEALTWVIVWVSLALLFNLLLWFYLLKTTDAAIAHQQALEFFTGYLIEESLSIDNMFIFILIFKYFAVPIEYQRRVLLFGVLGAIVMRLLLILLGLWLITRFHWILYVFGGFLLLSGIRLLLAAEKEPSLERHPLLVWMRKYLPVTKTFHKEQFFIIKNKQLHLTPLFLVLVLIEASDLIFALDSIPAIFAITEDPFIVFTSNIFAILGLRAMYFLLVNMSDRFHLLKYGIALILIFVGFKMLIAYWVKIPVFISLGFIIATLIMSILCSLMSSKNNNNN
ncbi:TerC/Alx family metal homeostasis membrane protein [Legionella hackeliae]|uniref:Integral membrane protein TerC n=1 Tax=Legionella hackeliae TaxID=449 RepID=A0A0A8UUF5_LEGHA|nr:TerC/Alx family metal homeostasis membrane protein [Legionella hackeliae]KTD09567.1 drug efflux protein [Legionella hackeliae]CEK11116.1 Integral membrane protein TerC [Legionella hackeliae]STX47868.1 drug efflux protein [Legionella hackeliae]